MSGLQEIILILLLALALFVLPRMAGRNRPLAEASRHHRLIPHRLTGRMRLALTLSIVWPLLAALFMRPWEGDWLTFACAGPGVVAIAWCFLWIKDGYHRYRR